MTIIAVDNYELRLMELVKTLWSLFPDDEILYFTDPLFALKYIFKHAVDVVFTESRMKPIEGQELSKIVHEHYKNTAVYCITDAAEKAKTVSFSTCLTRPVTANEIKNVLQTA